MASDDRGWIAPSGTCTDADGGPLRIGVDIGGTFTDVVCQDADGSLTFRKVLSTPPEYDRAVVDGVAAMVRARDGATEIDEIVHATTVATNAVLERRGSRTALLTTAGFRDVLELRRVRMPHLYDPLWLKPPPLIPRHLRFEVTERVTAEGEVLQPLDERELRRVAEKIRRAGVQAVAICFIHAHRHPAHEEEAGRIIEDELPGVVVSLSSHVIREQQEYERTAATAVNAYVRPIMSEYLAAIREGLDEVGVSAPLTIMQSAGGVMSAADAAQRPVYVLESGPAAGVIAARQLVEHRQLGNAIAFDMGGTTAKASLIEDGRVSWSREYEVGAALSAGSRLLRGEGEVLRVPSLDIAEVGAGGGSLAWFDPAGGLHVGPQSAGADPGPACYGLGGTNATVTDANVVLGYIPPGQLADGDLSVSEDAAIDAVAAIAERLGCSVIAAARGIHELANASMMRALRAVSSEKGRNPSDFALVAYGGSGPVHAAALAKELGVHTVFVPPNAGGFSATGLLSARPEFHDVRFCRIDARAGDPAKLIDLEREMRTSLATHLSRAEDVSWYRSADVRYKGQNWDIEIALPGPVIDRAALTALVAEFESEHERMYGVRHDDGAPIEIRALRLAAMGPQPRITPGDALSLRRSDPRTTRTADFGDGSGLVSATVCSRRDIGSAGRSGPLLVDEYDTTIVVPPGWVVRAESDGTLILSAVETTESRGHDQVDNEQSEVVTQGLVASALAAIADEMATTVFRTAHSTIVRDCMDFSASLCEANGEMIAQAVTIPLHLGSVPTAMDALLKEYGGAMRPGDVFIMNDPFSGGMHTPDVFIAKPIFLGARLIGYAVVTAHHADIGGRVSGTASCDNVDIFQEGLRMPWVRLYDQGVPVEAVHRLLKTNVRVPEMTLGDIRAQVAATHVADAAFQELAERYGPEDLARTMAKLLDHSERLVRQAIAAWPDGNATFADYMDSDGLEVRDVKLTVTVTVEGDELTVDFTDCAPMVRGALNGTRSFSLATVYQAVLSAVPADVPPTAGAFRPIHVRTRPGTITEVISPGASSMRGVTGFRLIDALNGALAQVVPERIPAAGEGGNSLAIFSGLTAPDSHSVFYELVVGTWGARLGADGNDGLSNPCATAANIPVEVAEADFPIIIRRYGFVCDSGGAGRFRGGLALERVWETVAPETQLQVRSDRQINAPYGLAGGCPGTTSMNLILESENGGATEMPPMFSAVLKRGTVFHHRMAGGGGWGDPLTRDVSAVAADVRDEKVSVRAASDQYGVVVTEDGTVDAAATSELRERRQRDAADRRPVPGAASR